MRNDFISKIDPSGKRHWWPGVFAIEHMPSGKRHYIGTANVGRRVRDNVDWLKLGVHPNPVLQAAWSPSAFRVVLVERVAVKKMVQFQKQLWLERDRLHHPAGVYNQRNAISANNPKVCGADRSLPPDFLADLPPPPPVDVFDRLHEHLGDHWFQADDPSPAQLRSRAEASIAAFQRLLRNP